MFLSSVEVKAKLLYQENKQRRLNRNRHENQNGIPVCYRGVRHKPESALKPVISYRSLLEKMYYLKNSLQTSFLTVARQRRSTWQTVSWRDPVFNYQGLTLYFLAWLIRFVRRRGTAMFQLSVRAFIQAIQAEIKKSHSAIHRRR